MIKIYIDWNVMSGMKENRYGGLEEILLDREKFYLLYSTSHIGDIFASISDDETQQVIIQQDIDYITHLTNNMCLVNNSVQVNLHQYDPRELLDDRINEASILTDFSLDSLFKTFEGDEMLGGIINMYKNLIASIPMDSILKEAYENPENSAMLNSMFPGLQDDMTINGFFKSFGKMYTNLNDHEGYKELRSIVQKIGVNSGHFNEHKNPFDVIGMAYSKFGKEESDPYQYFDKSKNAPQWYNEITNEYVILDMHGYKADKVKVTAKKKNTFRNTIEDASHTAFASLCDIYITHDDKNYHKAKAVYEKLNINTRVFKPDEFMQYYNNYLNVHGFLNHWHIMWAMHQNPDNFQNLNYESGEHFGWVCYSHHFFFDFFNKIMIPKPDKDSALFILGKETPARNYVLAFDEIRKLVEKLVDQFGIDSNGKAYFENKELTYGDWDGRHWETSICKFKLIRRNGWFQLYVFANKETLYKRIKNFVKKLFNKYSISKYMK